MALSSSHEALELTASFSFTADRLRAEEGELQLRARICETASRVAFLKASILARDEEVRPTFGQLFRKGVFAVA